MPNCSHGKHNYFHRTAESRGTFVRTALNPSFLRWTLWSRLAQVCGNNMVIIQWAGKNEVRGSHNLDGSWNPNLGTVTPRIIDSVLHGHARHKIQLTYVHSRLFETIKRNKAEWNRRLLRKAIYHVLCVVGSIVPCHKAIPLYFDLYDMPEIFPPRRYTINTQACCLKHYQRTTFTPTLMT